MAKLSKKTRNQISEFEISDILDAVEEIDQIRYMSKLFLPSFA